MIDDDIDLTADYIVETGDLVATSVDCALRLAALSWFGFNNAEILNKQTLPLPTKAWILLIGLLLGKKQF